jgi:hypothetical protein
MTSIKSSIQMLPATVQNEQDIADKWTIAQIQK